LPEIDATVRDLVFLTTRSTPAARRPHKRCVSRSTRSSGSGLLPLWPMRASPPR
jgi:hypothetical protein